MEAHRYRPFATGSQSGDWEESNCVRCTHYGDDGSDCPLLIALAEAYIGDGTIDEATARAIGYLAGDGTDRALDYVWPCASVEWTDEWKASQ